MGGVKQQMIEDEQNGFNADSDDSVCEKHFDDYGIKKYIKRAKIFKRCSYCRSPLSTPLNGVVLHLMKCVWKFYADPNDGEGIWDSENHAWADEYPDTNELLFDTLRIDVTPYKLQKEISRMLGDNIWVERDAYGYSEDDLLYDDWDFFSKVLKEQLRYVFFKVMVEKHSQFDLKNSKVDPSEILDDIGKMICDLSLFKKYSTRKTLKLYRARQHSKREKITDYMALSSPPKIKAKANRFSAAGISMFYGAEDDETAILEVINDSKTETLITVGKFIVNKNLNLITLTDLPYISIFDEENNKYCASIRFLKRFIENVSQPLKTGTSEHIEYVPTQVVTEYFRYIFPQKFNIQIDGIQYNSSKNKKKCYVLFFDEDDATQRGSQYQQDKALCLNRQTLNTHGIRKIKSRIKQKGLKQLTDLFKSYSV
jgi:hypothetical protein